MTTETTQGLPEVGPASDNGQGQSQGHRRRRRRRKNKAGQPAVAAATVAQQPQAPQPVAPQAPQPHRSQQPHQGPPQGRKKKKFFPKNTSLQPGNNNAPPQNRRKPKQQRGPREFVGPMDHSYRTANGNIDDGPPSTIQIGLGRATATHWEEPSMPPAQVREDAPVRIYCFIEDLFFLAKIQESARKLGVKVEFVKGADKEAVAHVLNLPEEERPALVIFDLGNANAKPLTLIPKFKTKFKKSVSVVGFVSHVLGDLKMKASEVGCDTVMPRSAFSQALPNMLRRYGIEEEEEEELSEQPV
jgi:hypothetical protein